MKKLLLLVFVFVVAKVQAQVVTAGSILSSYTDISPDSLLTYTITPFSNNVYSFDLVGDSLADIEFTARGSVSSGGSQAFIRFVSLDPDLSVRFGRWDSVFVPGSSSWNVTQIAEPLLAGDTINDIDAIWETGEMYLTDHSGSGGGVKDVNDWIGGEKYLGLKYNDGSNTDYGWMRIECPSADSCYVKDFSFTQGPLAVSRDLRSRISVYPNPASDVLNVAGGSVSSFEIRDPAGKVIMNGKDKREIYIKDLAEGLYLLHVRTGNRIENFRFVKL